MHEGGRRKYASRNSKSEVYEGGGYVPKTTHSRLASPPCLPTVEWEAVVAVVATLVVVAPRPGRYPSPLVPTPVPPPPREYPVRVVANVAGEPSPSPWS